MPKLLCICDGSAIFSEDRTRRYELRRTWGTDPRVCFCMLNPSLADETELDPTVRRCVGFARAWGMGGLVVVNLFSIVSPDPKVLVTHPDPVGSENDSHILRMAKASKLVICAWGAFPEARERGIKVAEMLRAAGVVTHCLGKTKAGYPKHPLYLKADTKPEVF
jgi:hypothetical protein